jgi:hypothetical protein
LPCCSTAFREAGVDPLTLLNASWPSRLGELPAEDKRANDAALNHGDRIVSAYHLLDGVKAWIITAQALDADESLRMSTCLLLPGEPL